jgi:hypothetical protein
MVKGEIQKRQEEMARCETKAVACKREAVALKEQAKIAQEQAWQHRLYRIDAWKAERESLTLLLPDHPYTIICALCRGENPLSIADTGERSQNLLILTYPVADKISRMIGPVTLGAGSIYDDGQWRRSHETLCTYYTTYTD